MNMPPPLFGKVSRLAKIMFKIHENLYFNIILKQQLPHLDIHLKEFQKLFLSSMCIIIRYTLCFYYSINVIM